MDNETYGGQGNEYDYGFRIYNPRIGRFLSIDPLTQKYPWYTPYSFSGNKPLKFVDLDGLEDGLEIRSRQKEEGYLKGTVTAEELRNYYTATGLGGAMGVGIVLTGGAIIKYGPEIYTWAVNAGIWLSNPSNQLLLSSATGFAVTILNPDPNGLPLDFPGAGDEIGNTLKNIFRTPVNVPGFLKSAGVEAANLIKGLKGDKVAVIGQGMERILQIANGLKNPEVFKPTEEAVKAWTKLLTDYKGKLIPEDVVKTTQLYKENVKWIDDVKKAGYDILDLGGGNTSTFYNMKKKQFMELQNNLQIIQQLIVERFSFLERLEYIQSVNEKKDPTFLESVSVEYINESRKRKIEISFTKSKVYHDIKHTFHVIIVRIPYADPTKDFFSLEIYLDSLKKNFSTSLTNYFNLDEAKIIVENLANSLKENIPAIIEGTQWLTGFYPHWN